MNYAFFAETFPWLSPKGQYFAAIFLVLFMAIIVVVLESRGWNKQKMALEDWKFDEAYMREVLMRCPHLSETEVTEAFKQLRLFFRICWQYDMKLVAMPSKLVDTCWHVFICDTRQYARFCEAVLGRFLHHEPPCGGELQKEDASERNQLQMLALARAYKGALKEALAIIVKDKVIKKDKAALPILTLFAIDEHLQIENGFCYSEEFLKSLSEFDLEKAEARLSNTDGAADGSAAGCGDGGSCGCGGSV